MQFIKELVDYIRSDYQPAIDRHRVYIFGFSSGAGLVFPMLCFQHGPFRSFAVISQAIQEESTHCGVGADSSVTATLEQQEVYLGYPEAQKYGVSNGGRAKPVIYMHGTSDGNLDADPITTLPRNDPDATVSQLTMLNDTAPSSIQIMNYLDILGNVPYTTRNDYIKRTGSTGKSFTYYKIHNGDHSVSTLQEQGATSCRSGTYAGIDCAHNTDYSSVDEVWSFWNTVVGLNLP